MKSIVANITNEIIINKSRFIANLTVVHDLNQMEDALSNIKNKYKDASHHCYAYIIDNYKKASDDGEPSGTAGLPILNVLENNDLNHILCIVTRYFGGIKLGSGGLVRAYSKSTVEALNKAKICNLETGFLIKIIFNYEIINDINYLLSNVIVTDKTFDDIVTYTIQVSEEKWNIIKDKIKDLSNQIDIIEKLRRHYG